MNYRNPVRLVAHAGESLTDVTSQTFNRARRKLLAELSLAGQELVIDGRSYGRNDITSLLDADDIEKRWPSHCYVYALPALLDFLETAQFDMRAFNDEVHPGEAPDPAFLSPYFAASFNEASRVLLRERNYWRLVSLQSFQYLIQPEDSDEAYQRIRVHLDELLHLVRNMNWEKLSQDRTQLDFLFADGFASFLNSLPSSLSAWRDNFVMTTVLLVARLQKKAKWKALHLMCMQLQTIECSPSTRAEVDRFEGAMARNIRFDKGEGSSGFRPYYFGIMIVVAILRFALSGNNSSYTSTHLNFSDIKNLTIEGPPQGNTAPSRMQASFTHLIDSLNGHENKGVSIAVANGSAPFSDISHVPKDNAIMGVRVNNRTKQDVVMMCLPNHPSSWETELQFESLYIRHDSSVYLTFTPSFTRIYFITGRDWIKLDRPAQLLPGSQQFVNEYFRTAPKQQAYLSSFILLLDSTLKSQHGWSEDSAQLVYRPAPQAYGSRNFPNAELNVVEKGGKMRVNGAGTVFIYRENEKDTLF